MSNQIRNLILAVITLAFVAGCGGSGGNDGNPNPIFETGELVTITSDNATTVAGVVAEQALEDNLFGALTSSGLPVMSAGSGAAIALTSLSAVPLPPNMLGAQSMSSRSSSFPNGLRIRPICFSGFFVLSRSRSRWR